MIRVLSALISVKIDEACPIKSETDGSAQADFLFGDGAPDTFELIMHAEALREFLPLATKALAEMDAIYAKEEPANDPRND